jgi:hypothetical protein
MRERTRRLGLGLALLAGACAATAWSAEDSAAKSPCDGAEHRQFDFWAGDWRVTEKGKLAGHNRIEKILGGCALLESWRGAGELRGHSLNFYDSADGHWHQTWVDSAGGSLDLVGGFERGAMVLSGRRPPRGDSDASTDTIHRITWSPRSDGTVRQHWESSQDEGKTWSTLFDGIYAQSPAAKASD